MTTTHQALTIDICTEDGARTRFQQNDTQIGEITLRQLVSPRLFSPPLLTFASEHSVSAIPTRTIDMILAHTASPPPLPLPSGWVDAVEVNDDALIHHAELEAVAAAENKHVMLAEIHRLKAGGIGAINSANIVRGTLCPPLDGIAQTALAAELSQCIRS